MKMLFILSAVLLVVCCVALLAIREKRQTVEHLEFSTAPYDQVPVRISGLLIRPRACGSEKIPGVVFCHGLTCNKEIYLGMCRRIAALGIAVLAIDLRGHGHSGGPSEFGKSEQHEIWAALDVLRKRDDIDPDRLGVIGHSMGGIAATRATFMQSPVKIRAAVAIYCWKSMREAVEAVFGPLDVFVGRWWPFFGWSRQFSLSDEQALDERSVMEHLRPEVATNYMLIVGSRDPLTDMKRSAEIVAKAAGESTIEPHVVYGDVARGSTRCLAVVKRADHLSVLSKKKTIGNIRGWLEKSFALDRARESSGGGFTNIVRILRAATLVLFFVGVLACSLWALRSWGAADLPHGVVSVPPRLLFGAIAVFLLCSVLSIPLARAIGMKPFVSHWGGDIVSIVMASRAMVFVPLLVLLVVVLSGLQNPWGELLGLAPRRLLPGVAVSVVVVAWLLCSWNMVARTNWFPTIWPVARPPMFFMIFAVFLAAYLAEEAVFRGIMQNGLSNMGPVGEIGLSTLTYAVVGAIAWILALWTLFPSPMYAGTFRSHSLPLMPVVFAFGLVLLSAHGFVAAVLFHFTRTIAAPAVFFALLMSFLLSAPIGVRTY